MFYQIWVIVDKSHHLKQFLNSERNIKIEAFVKMIWIFILEKIIFLFQNFSDFIGKNLS